MNQQAQKRLRVAVVGAGAVGSLFGGLLQCDRPDIEVTLLARGSHGEMMRRQGGVNVRGPWGERLVRLRIATDPAELRGSDYVLLTVKSHAVAAAMDSVAPYIDQAILVSVQNGINQHILGTYVPKQRLVMGMTAMVIAVSKPGTVELRRRGPTIFGPASTDESLTTALDAAEMFRHTELRITVHRNILGAQYNKLIFNCLGAASSLSASDFLGEAVTYRPWRQVVGIPLQREALEVLTRVGIRLARIPGGADVYRFRRLLHGLDQPVLGFLINQMIRKFFSSQPIRFSIQADLQQGKATEVDYINGEIVRLASQHGLTAPLNALVVRLVHQLEETGRFLTLDEVVSYFENQATA